MAEKQPIKEQIKKLTDQIEAGMRYPIFTMILQKRSRKTI